MPLTAASGISASPKLNSTPPSAHLALDQIQIIEKEAHCSILLGKEPGAPNRIREVGRDVLREYRPVAAANIG
jgi:hypothetical protein